MPNFAEILRFSLLCYIHFDIAFKLCAIFKCLIYYFSFAACGFLADVFYGDFTVFFPRSKTSHQKFVTDTWALLVLPPALLLGSFNIPLCTGIIWIYS